MENIVIGIVGMSCQNCVKGIAAVLQALPGVERVEVSLAAGQASVTFDAGRLTVAQLRDAIESAGFDVS
jgi:copper chaperone